MDIAEGTCPHQKPHEAAEVGCVKEAGRVEGVVLGWGGRWASPCQRAFYQLPDTLLSIGSCNANCKAGARGG